MANTFKTESIRKLGNFNFQWTKTLYQNNLNNVAFFFTFKKRQKRNKSSLVTPKKYLMEVRENEGRISEESRLRR